MAAEIPFRRDYAFEYGVIEQVAPAVRRVVARNPSPFTFHGTGTYIIGRGRVAVIDPGPDMDDHVAAILDGLSGEQVTHLLVTHTHRDHSPACRAVQAATGARTYGYGPHGAGKLEQDVKVEEGGDADFVPDVEVRHGDVIEGNGWSVECVYTPGHTSNHICYQFREQKILFSGDHVMAWSTSVISPPDGDMAHYMESLNLLLERDDAVYWPTHGPCIEDPKQFVRGFITHRHVRERQILACLSDGVDKISDMVPLMYRELPGALYPAAARSVFATVIYLVRQGKLKCEGELSIDARYANDGS
ncbi:MAG: MBL fold metallo-hydrolase [Gammaproteobacteria bacterium]